MSSTTQKLISRDIKARQETRRGTVLTEPKLLNFDTAAINKPVYVVDVDIGATRPVRNVIVKSPIGSGGRSYAGVGKAIEIQRNAGGRWIAIGASDRVTSTGVVTVLDESTDSTTLGVPKGFTGRRRPHTYYKNNLAWGIRGYGDTIIFDAEGNEVF